MNNTGSAIIIVGTGYLYLVYHLDVVWTSLGIALGLVSWLTVDNGYKKLLKRYLELRIQFLEGKIKRSLKDVLEMK